MAGRRRISAIATINNVKTGSFNGLKLRSGSSGILSWDFLSKLFIIAYSVLQILRLPLFPQFLDIYYHLHTAWGFIQAGGYSPWDFWEYSPVGRMHIYPPFFHVILAFFIKAGVNKIILAKTLEATMPVIVLLSVRHFVKKNYSRRLAFFSILMCGSSFSFYTSLINHIPAALAIIFGLFTFDQLLCNRPARAVILLALGFYTHIGMSWFFALSLLAYGLIVKAIRRQVLLVFLAALALSAPMIAKQASAAALFDNSGLGENWFCEFKILDYMLGLAGLIAVFKKAGRFLIFFCFLLASFIFVLYPYRFFSAQGYLPILFLSAVSLDSLYEHLYSRKTYLRYLPHMLAAFILLASPTILMETNFAHNRRVSCKSYLFDSALIDMIFPQINGRIPSASLWRPTLYSSTADLIVKNSEPAQIIYSTWHVTGVCLAALAGRPTANALIPEIKAAEKFDPLEVSRIFVAVQNENPEFRDYAVKHYGLAKIGENKCFIIYKNPHCAAKAPVRRAAAPFGFMAVIGLLAGLVFCKPNILKLLTNIKIYGINTLLRWRLEAE